MVWLKKLNYKQRKMIHFVKRKGINKKTQVIRADTRVSLQRVLRQKPGFPHAHPGI
jgi:hypothetical protein